MTPDEAAFLARPLGLEHVDQAWPLVAMAGGRLTRDHWRAFAAAVTQQAALPRPGIMTLQSAKGYIHAVFRFRVERGAGPGCVLIVDDVMAAAIFDRGLTEALVRAIETLARNNGCGAIDVALLAAGGGGLDLVDAALRRAGYAPRAGSLRKDVAKAVAQSGEGRP